MGYAFPRVFSSLGSSPYKVEVSVYCKKYIGLSPKLGYMDDNNLPLALRPQGLSPICWYFRGGN